ncbi:hypothetical protein [Synechococcus sp. CBW1107]|nr:hypothetical protein [Synechococcus sp. CBW1107]CAK6689188.1 hypothetical protein ICNINCKA_00556 [Synechococcus sp. CBW1107]
MTITISPAGISSADRSIRRAASKRSGLKAPGSKHQAPPSWEDLLGRR